MDIRKEIEFWTNIMRDHGEFQLTSLAPEEKDVARRASYFMNLFEKLNDEVKTNRNSIPDLISICKDAVKQFIDFKRHMLTGLMTCNLKLRMTPSFLNHMINEALEFLHVLNLADHTLPCNNTLENIRLHKIWLPDASGHASAVATELDAIEVKLGKEAREFSKKFDGLFKKAFEMYHMYERTGLENGALCHFNEEVIKTLKDFINYLDRIERYRKECSIYASGTFSPLIPNHMIREESYYIYKIDEFNKEL